MVEPSEDSYSTFAIVPRPVPNVTQPRWLNIVFDLNGILCACEEFRLKPSNLRYKSDDAPHSSTIPAQVGPKLVWVRPGCKAFLRGLSKFATISVWSSMKVTTTRSIAAFLFKAITPPKVIRGQEHCAKIVTSIENRRKSFLKVKGTEKDVFLKTLAHGLFPVDPECFTNNNTIVVDDSAYKHVLNNPENVLLSETWSYKGDGPNDTFLLGILLPWLQRLHNSADLGLRSFRIANPLGLSTLCSDPYNVEYIELTAAIAKSNHLV